MFFVLCKSVWFSPTAMLTWKKGSLRQRMEIKMSRAFWHCKACTIIHYGGKTRHAMDVLPRFFISKKCCCGVGGGKTDIFFSGVGLRHVQRSTFKWKVILEYYTGNMKVIFVNATVLLTSKCWYTKCFFKFVTHLHFSSLVASFVKCLRERTRWEVRIGILRKVSCEKALALLLEILDLTWRGAM